MTATIQTMRAEVPGSLGFLPDDIGVRALMLFLETDSDIAPVEELGVLSAVRPAGAATFPAITDGFTGRARQLVGNAAIQATDGAGRILLERTVSVAAIVAWDHASASGAESLVAHGVGGSSAQRRSWHLRLSKPSPGVGRMQWVWQDRAGTEYAQPGGEFFLPADGFLLIAATREWCGDHFELRYWIGETLIGSATSTDLEVGGGLGATVTIGCVGDGAGGFTEFFHGRVDQIAVFGEAFTDAQVAHFWQRIAVLPEDTYVALREIQSPGDGRSREPESLVQRRLRVQSGLVAATSSLVAMRADAGLPDRAYGPRLALWERATGQTSRPGDSIATRRARVLEALRGERGLTPAALQEALAPFYGIDPEDLEIITFDNLTLGIDYPAWGEWGDGGVLVDAPADTLTLRVKAGASYSTSLGGYAYRTAALDEVLIACTVGSASLSNDDLFVGLEDYPQANRAGLKLDTSTSQLVNTLTGANVQSYTLPVDLRVYRDGDQVLARVNGGAAITLGTAPSGLDFAAVALVPISASAPGSARSAVVSNLCVQNRDSCAPQTGYFYAATADDLAGARRQLLRQQPAHIFAAALTSRVARCEDSVNGVETAPLVETAADMARSMFPVPASHVWAGAPADLIAGAVLTPAGAGAQANEPSVSPFGDQALAMAAGTADKWAMPAVATLSFSSTKSTAFLLVYYLNAFTLGTSYTLLGNCAGAELQGFEVAISAAGALVVRFDSGVGAPTELTFRTVNTDVAAWHALVVRFDHALGRIMAATELQLLEAAFAGNAASTVATALGAYRTDATPDWRCPMLAVFDADSAQDLDVVGAAVYAHRTWSNLLDHPAALQRILGYDISIARMWSGSTIDDVSLAPLTAENSAGFVAGTYASLTGPYVMSLTSTQAWAAQSAGVVQMDERSALFILAVDLTSFTGGVFNAFCGNRTGVGATDAGFELTISTSGRVTFNADDAVGAVVGVQLPSLSNASAGKHVFVIKWEAGTGAITLASELELNTGSFAGRSATSSGLFRLGSFRGLVSATFKPLFFAVCYGEETESVDALSLAARLFREI